MSQEQLERALAQRAEDVHGAPFSFDDVRGRAVSIRRRRRAAVAGAVAAAVALVVIVPTVLTGGGTPGSKAPEPAPAPVPGHTAVLHDGTLTLPDGGTVPVDVDNEAVLQLGLLTDGRIVMALQDPYAVRVYQPDGELQEEYAVAVNLITMSATDDAVAWIGEDRGVRVLSSGEPEPAVLPGIPAAGESPGAVDAVLGPEEVLVNGVGFTDQVLNATGATDINAVEPFTVTDVNADGSVWAVQFEPESSDDQDGCVGLYDPEADTIVARNCDTSFLEFSPDGQHLLGVRGDNMMFGGATVLDLDLNPVQTYDPADRTAFKDVAWADASHLLIVVAGIDAGSDWTLVRDPIDGGTAEPVAGPVVGPSAEDPSLYLLSE